jgi:VTC domain
MKPVRAPTLDFLRFEFKYVLSEQARQGVEAELCHFATMDPYVAAQPDGQYFVRSLYYDDVALSAFHEKDDGLLTRMKFRLRTYARNCDDDAPWFLEIKGRHNQLVWKRRTPVAGDFDKRARGEALTKVILRHAQPSEVRDRFEFAVYRHGIQPCALVDYVRRPYVSKFDPDFRLTLDSQLAAWRVDSLSPSVRDHARAVLRGYTVMEAKFRHRVPAWFHRILQSHELRRRSLSKIGESLVALGLCSAES